MSIYKFGNDLTKIRENKRISQEDLAFLSGISRRSISRIENGLIKEPSIDTLLKLSASLDADIVDLYIKDIYESQYLYRELLSSFDILSSFKSREEILLLEKKVDILEKDHNFKGKDYELALMKLFIKSLKTPILLSLTEEFEDITSARINKNNILTRDLSFLEARLLINVCNNKAYFKNIDRKEILSSIIDKNDESLIKLIAYYSLVNVMDIERDSLNGLEKINEAISFAKYSNHSEMFAFLYYLKFLCQHELGDENYRNSIKLSRIFASHLDKDGALKSINQGIGDVLGNN
ncbi:helix-turn-helix domain-containing protein [Anaerococcus sp. NML200574]|uniref:helix-turn-helix domain-containing protein n=1 Tax=unclassified Anaerococcus TaxID=2614126 RepID=UPI000D0BC895|nr:MULTISPECIES: helix-turn-helix transcriptional regulator [unclassified Anaerococcus]MCW6678353.1 helix-turn-helix domain-containing protein [Anaerococcus sp. NML200574]MCW6701320.1 helix-turn-helix domain-containing protein [Anaerococcus sp. NML200537]